MGENNSASSRLREWRCATAFVHPLRFYREDVNMSYDEIALYLPVIGLVAGILSYLI